MSIKSLDFGKKTYIMGILNVTPDSFSDGNKYLKPENAVSHAIKMEKDGADIIDIGGESTRPGATGVSKSDEAKRILPIIEELVDKISIPISVDTYKSDVAMKALDLGVDMINDITALQGDKKIVNIIENYNAYICLMHMKGNPRNMQKNPIYDDVIKEICDFLKERAEYAIFHGIKKEKIIIDPGLGFGKRTGRGIEDNCEILSRLNELKSLGFPILVGPSRKTFIGNVCGKNKQLPATDRLEGSLAAACVAVMNGVDIVRVHDVKETRRCVDFIDCIIRKNKKI
jgi:dihydropteroate synthase